MPAPLARNGRLVPEQEFEDRKEAERQARIDRFVARAGGPGPQRNTRNVLPMDAEEWEPPEVIRSHDPHTLEAARARYVEALNSRG